MMLIRIILGLLGLGVVVFVHELGHFLAARLMGIGVEAFSIGWGKPIFKKKIGEVEYRLGIFPLGGYCKMKGDGDYEEVYNKSKEGIKAEEGSYFAAHPFRRIVACLAGPLFNFIFAVIVFAVIWGVGFEVNTLGNRIILASEVIPESHNPSDEAGLMTGDRIVSIMGRDTETFNDIQEIIAINPGEYLPMVVDRDGEHLGLTVRPVMDRSTGAGRIGVYFWTDPVIGSVASEGPAYNAGLTDGDRILSINNTEVPHTIALITLLENMPETLNIEYYREGRTYWTVLVPEYGDNGAVNLGISWEAVTYQNPRLWPHQAIIKGISETWRTFSISVRSLSLLFSGIDISQAVSGPIRITYLVGDVAAEGFSQGIGTGLSAMAGFLALISIALCMMNLLPLPILDGGMIIMFIAEGIWRRPLHPRLVSVFQTLGIVIIAGLMFFAIFGDIRYLANIIGRSN